MNNIYKVVWNKNRQAWQAVSECASNNGKATTQSKGKRSCLLPQLVAGSLLIIALHSFALAQDLPTGGQVNVGSGQIATSGQQMTINQTSQNMVVDWQSFSIGKDASVNFIQPNAQAAALNRVLGNQVSTIQGALKANGQVFLVNPNGILFSPSARVDVGSLVSSTLNITNQNFLDGNYRFEGSSGNAVINQGNIQTLNGGTVAFIAAKIINTGSISTPKGNTLMGAGSKVVLDLGGPVKIEVEASEIETYIKQGGAIKADGGTVYLTAKAANALTSSVINHTGITQAQTLASGEDGTIILMGDMNSGLVQVAGTIDASAPISGEGGFVETSAAKVKVDDVKVTTKATNGQTGEWLIDPRDFTIAASGGDITGANLSNQLISNNVIIESYLGAIDGVGDIFVNDSLAWSANTLTLNAWRNIYINTEMNATNTAGLALKYGQGAAGGIISGKASDFHINAPINLASTGSFSTQLGNAGAVKNYIIITHLGTAGSTTGTDLQGIRGDLSGHYVLGANINASSTTSWNAGKGFQPIGILHSSYKGTFDGLGHSISNLFINRPAETNIGLFDVLGPTGKIKNIRLQGGSIRGDIYVGGLVGFNNYGSISNSYTNSSVVGSYYVAGGLVGYNNQGTISNSYNIGSVAGYIHVGGLAGYNDKGFVENSYNSGSVIGTAYSTAGLVGYNINGTINNSYNDGSVKGKDYLGGLVGNDITGKISNSYNSGTITGTGNQVGGLIGSSNGIISNSYNVGDVIGINLIGGLVGGSNYQGSIVNSYSTSKVTGKDGVGGLIGKNYNDKVSNSYSTGVVIGDSNVGGLTGYNNIVGSITNSFYATTNYDSQPINNNGVKNSIYAGNDLGTAKTWIDLTKKTTFNDWDITNSGGSTAIWRIYEGDTSPLLRSFFKESVVITIDTQNIINKTYDGIIASGSLNYTSNLPNPLLDGSLTYKTTSKNVANYTTIDGSLIINGLYSNQQGYDISYTPTSPTSLTINKATISSISNIVAKNKIYDGNTNSTLKTADAIFLGLITNDKLNVSTATGVFNNKNAVTGKVVNISNLSLGGDDANNYNLAVTTASTTASITPKAITVSGITAAKKIYDATSDASVDTSNASGWITGDDVTLTATGSFIDKNAGDLKQVKLTSSYTGIDVANYVISDQATTTADIAKKAITVSGITAAKKIYDATSDASVDTSNASGWITGDEVILSAAGSFIDKNAGDLKQVKLTSSYTGIDVANYVISDQATTTASITPKAITVSGITAANKTYDGSTAALVDTGSVSGWIAGDDVQVTAMGYFVDEAVGTNKQINLSSSYKGSDVANYDFIDQAITYANIMPKLTNNNTSLDDDLNKTPQQPITPPIPVIPVAPTLPAPAEPEAPETLPPIELPAPVEPETTETPAEPIEETVEETIEFSKPIQPPVPVAPIAPLNKMIQQAIAHIQQVNSNTFATNSNRNQVATSRTQRSGNLELVEVDEALAGQLTGLSGHTGSLIPIFVVQGGINLDGLTIDSTTTGLANE